jgi:hypothetical protein
MIPVGLIIPWVVKHRRWIVYGALAVASVLVVLWFVDALKDLGRAEVEAAAATAKLEFQEMNMKIRELMNEDRNNRPDPVALDNILQRGTF